MLKSLIAWVCVVLSPLDAPALTMEMVTVGDANTGFWGGLGSVGYVYQIGKHEVRNDQYAKFLNAVAATDTHGLYSTNMEADARGGIIRSGSSGSYVYSVKANMADKPVNFVSFFDVVRFVNWLENGQPAGGQGAGTTETGSYTISISGSTTNVSDRASGATWVLPTQTEWRKAAFYDPSPMGPPDHFWEYATRSDVAPTMAAANTIGDISNPGTNVANFGLGADWNEQDGNVTSVGSAGVLSSSYYGTFDQNGNVREWPDGFNGGFLTVVMGGGWNGTDGLAASSWDLGGPFTREQSDIGFRVGAIPRPSSLAGARQADGAVRLELRGNAGLSHLIEVSDNLTNWQPWAIVTIPAGGWSTNFSTDPEIPRRFWRARHGDAPPGFVLIPPGSFQMGDSFTEGGTAERPVHAVYVSAFYMQSTEVTKAQWDEVRTWGSTHGYTDLSAGAGKASNHPVQRVSWYAVVKWCNARSEKENLTPCYTVAGATYKTGWSAPVCNFSANGYRLPTEAEWEKAARGGSSGHRFPWSDAETITHNWANYDSSTSYSYDVSATRGYHPAFATGGTPYTSPVGYFAANGYGLYDMAGNVWEWCWDWYGGTYYWTSPSSDPAGPTADSYRVLRGGGWHGYAGYCRVADREYISPDGSGSGIGFRPVRR